MWYNTPIKPVLDSSKTPQAAAAPVHQNLCRTFTFILSVSIGSVLFGYVLASTTTIPVPHLIRQFHIHGYRREILTAILAGIAPIGAIFGSWASNYVIKLFSRRHALIMTALMAILGTLLTLVSKFEMLVVGRTLQGFCIGIQSSLVPLIINEIAPVGLNGIGGVINHIFLVIGTACTSIFALYIESDPNAQISPIWRLIYGFPIISLVIQLLLLLFVFKEETPRYLLENDRQFQAVQLIRSMYTPQTAEQMVEAKLRQYQTDKTALQKEEQSVERAHTCLSKRTFLALHIAALNQMCGFNIIIVYGVDIMNHAVKDIHTAKLLQLPLYGMQIIFTLLSLVLMQKMDRKKVIQMGTAMCLSTLLLMSIGLLEYEKYSIQQKILVVGSLFIFMACFRLTLGPVTWVYIFEISDEGVAGKAATIKWTTCCLTVIIFPIIGKAINPGYLFLFLSGWCVVSLIINHMYVVETKNRSKQDIAKDFAGKDN